MSLISRLNNKFGEDIRPVNGISVSKTIVGDSVNFSVYTQQ